MRPGTGFLYNTEVKLKLYNALTRTKEEFAPTDSREVRMYSCGLTVYSDPHIGNLRAYIFTDTLRRALLAEGYAVRHVMNITDVGHLTSDADEGEDKLERAAREKRQDAYALAEHYTEIFRKNLEELNIFEPTIWTKATEHIKEQIALVKKIEEAGYTYTTSDGVYFDTGKLKDYGKLARLNVEGQKEGARVEKNPEKKNASDFALWKFSPKGVKRQMEWDSPWGKGFPGWHIECTAMSTTYLGELFDIHTGGVDHLTVHHPNEMAQAQAAFGTDQARFWLHNEHLVVDKGRMGKSEGNAVTLETLKERGYAPLAFRYFVLSAHYRTKLTFSWEAMDGAQAAYEKLLRSAAALEGKPKIGCAEYEQRFREAIEDDLNTPRALAVLWDLFKSGYPDEAIKESLFAMDEVLGLGLADAAQEHVDVPEEVQALVDEREEARKVKDFARSDELRRRIAEKGFAVNDTPDGPALSRR